MKRSRDYNLEQRGPTWYVVLDVPPSLRDVVGRKRLRKSTGTTDKLKARLKRDAILGEFRAAIERARRGGVQGWHQEALAWRQEIAALDDNDERGNLELALQDKAEAIEREHDLERARAFYDIASGQKTPLAMHHEAWLAEKQFAARQVSDYRNQVKRLEAWMVSKSLSPSVQAVTDKVASEYKADGLVKQGVNFKTGNKWLSGLRSYWKWMLDEGHAKSNPWLGKSLPKIRQPKDHRERNFTDDEMRLLLAGKPDAELSAAMHIAALSGMRLQEIFRLQVQHCKDGIFRVAYGYRGKTDAAERDVPIHSSLLSLIEGLCEGRKGTDYILQGSKGGWGETRSMACSIPPCGRVQRWVAHSQFGLPLNH